MSLCVLDTDTTTLLLRGQLAVCDKAAAHDAADLAITIVNVEEILTGWYTQIRRARKDDQLERAYGALQEAVEFVARVRILPFDREAIQKFRSLKSAKPRAGTNDLKIAAIALIQKATLVTVNLSDFEHLPGLSVEDWSK